MPTALQYKDMGNEEFKKGNHGKAIEYYTYATEMDPNNAIFFTNRSFAYFKMGNFEKSKRDADKACSKDPKWAKGFYRSGMASMELKQYEEALKAFKKAYEIDAKDTYQAEAVRAEAALMDGMSAAEIHKRKGNECFKSGAIEDAIKAYGLAINAANNDDEEERKIKADSYANRAACYRQLYNPEGCIDDCTACLEIDPANVKAYVRRAQAYEQVEKYKKALADYEAATRLNSSTTVAVQGASRVRTALKSLGLL